MDDSAGLGVASVDQVPGLVPVVAEVVAAPDVGDGGCHEVYGTTPEGDRVEAYFDPLTFEKPLVSRRGEVLFRADDKVGDG